MLKDKGIEKEQQALMPILDVWTCWSSLHQMLSMLSIFLQNKAVIYWIWIKSDCVLGFKEDIGNFSVQYKDLHSYKLSNQDWEAISTVHTPYVHRIYMAVYHIQYGVQP